MIILIDNPVQATLIFDCVFLIALLISARIKKFNQFFPISQSHELKGLAILFIVFSHIGYFLVTDHRFLFPLSIMAGVGVDLFLFLSGLGLTTSALKKKLSIFHFYKKNLLKLFTPFWLTLILFLLLDFFVLKISYSQKFIQNAFIGFFPSADLYKDLDSPLWYFSLILFYYLIFPLLFSKKRPWISAIFIYAVSYFILGQHIVSLSWVSSFYRLHVIAFPLGMIAGWAFYELHFDYKISKSRGYVWLKSIAHKIVEPDVLSQFKKHLFKIGYYAVIVLLIIFICYFSLYFGGQADPNKAQVVSIITMLAIICLFSLKKVEFKLLHLFGIYSYEIYLLHWPILYRYDIFYKYLPSWVATVFYLIFFLLLAFILKKISGFILNIIKNETN
jgi:peptidoglycan/LPS O-acetylase OafA/YrhL